MKKILNQIIVFALVCFFSNFKAAALTQEIKNALPDSTKEIQGAKCSIDRDNDKRDCTGTTGVSDVNNIIGYLAVSDSNKETDAFLTSVKFYDDVVLICTDHEEISPSWGGTTCTKSSDDWDRGVSAGVAAIIKQVPKEKFSKTQITTEYMLASYAINQFLFENNLQRQNIEKEYPLATNTAEYESYMKAARDAKNNSSNPTITLSSNSLNFTKKDGKYVSQEITISSNVNDYKIEHSDNITVNRNGNKFTVSVDANDDSIVLGTPLDVKLTITATKSIDQARNYKCISGTEPKQTLTPANFETLNLTETVSISGQITVKASLTIKKQDENKKLLPGVVLKVESKENNYSQTFTTTNEEIKIEDLKYGKYTITEISTPEGYVKLKEPKEVVISKENLEETVILTNDLTKVEISKISSVDSKPLKGAVLQIQDKDGNVIKTKDDKKYEWTTTEETYVVTGLVPGTYYLVEISAPEGYELNKEKIEFKVDGEKSVIKVEMKNNIEVKVPNTLSSRSALLITISMFDIFLGIGIITYVKKNKVQE